MVTGSVFYFGLLLAYTLKNLLDLLTGNLADMPPYPWASMLFLINNLSQNRSLLKRKPYVRQFTVPIHWMRNSNFENFKLAFNTHVYLTVC